MELIESNIPVILSVRLELWRYDGGAFPVYNVSQQVILH